jgi:hypothetical protein
MEHIKQYAFSLCVCALISTLILMLIPKSNLSKVVKITLSVFFLSSFLSPFLWNIDLKSEIERYSPISFEEEYNKQYLKTNEYLINEVQLEVERIVLSELSNIGVQAIDVDIKIKNTNYQEFYIESVEIYLNKEDIKYQTDVYLKAKEVTGINPQIIF